MKHLKLLIFFLIFCIGVSKAQITPDQQKTVDSLQLVVEETENDTVAINALEAIILTLYRTDPDRCLAINDEIRERCAKLLDNPELPLPDEEKVFFENAAMAARRSTGFLQMIRGQNDEAFENFRAAYEYYVKVENIKRQAQVLGYMGWLHQVKGDKEAALEAYLESLDMKLDLLEDTLGAAENLTAIGMLYQGQGEYATAREYIQRSYDIFAAQKINWGMANSLATIGELFNSEGNYASAIEAYTRSLTIAEQGGDNFRVSNNLAQIAAIYREQKEYEKALGYAKRSLELSTELKNKNGIANANLTIGEIYISLEIFDKAGEFLNEGLVIAKEMGDKNIQLKVETQLAKLYFDQRDYDRAYEASKSSLEMAEEIGDKSKIVSNLILLGDTYYQKGDYKKANQYNLRALTLSKDVGMLVNIQNATKSLYRGYKREGKQSLALQMYEQYINARDSLESEENQKEVIRQEFKYTYEKQAFADSIRFAELKKVQDAELAAEKAISQQRQQRSYFLLGGLALALFLGGFIYKQKNQVEEEKEKSEELLLNILPKATAEELKANGKVSAQSFDMASVIFTDFIGFTGLSAQMSAEELVKEIDICFTAFDEIVGKYGIEKIKTIGDAYMAVGGIPEFKDNHAENTIRAALEIQNYMGKRAMEKRKLDEPYFEARIGIHSGPLVGGVVGRKKFQYDVWGDSVNVASRMESACAAGNVNVSNATFQIIKNIKDFNFEHRGAIDVKGKGEMDMYYVRQNW